MAGRTVTSQLLGQFPIFAELEESLRIELAKIGNIHLWDEGQTIFQRADADHRMLAIISGRVRLSLMAPQGRELVLKTIGVGEVLGELALLDGEPRSTDATALEPTSAISLSREPFLQIANRHPHLSLTLAKYLCKLIRSATFQMESIALYDLNSRLIRFLLMTIQKTHGLSPPKEVRVELGLSQTDLAAILGATRSRLNNALQDLIAKQAIKKDGVAIVCSMPRLKQLSETAEIELM